MNIYHIIPSAQWELAQAEGIYEGDTLASEGFIHFSRRDQILWVANRRYVGHTGLQLLEVDTDKLGGELKHEPPYEDGLGDITFPHLYAPLNLSAVVKVYDFEPNPDGTFSLPDGL